MNPRDKTVEALMVSPSAPSAQPGKTRLLFTTFVAVLSALIALIILPATRAAAAPNYTSALAQQNVNLRPCVHSTGGVCSPVGTTTNATAARMICWRDGAWATGRYSSNRWFLVEANSRGGPEGFVHSSFVTNQTAVPNCSNIARVRAVDWALTQVGQTHASSDYRQGVWGMDWTPGPDREWAGDCAKLPFIAYKRQGISYPLADAIRQWERMPSRQTGSTYYPRFGDPVFWDIARPYGHTALYVGGTKAVGTTGMDFNGTPVAIYDLTSRPNYLGYGRVA